MGETAEAINLAEETPLQRPLKRVKQEPAVLSLVDSDDDAPGPKPGPGAAAEQVPERPMAHPRVGTGLWGALLEGGDAAANPAMGQRLGGERPLYRPPSARFRRGALGQGGGVAPSPIEIEDSDEDDAMALRAAANDFRSRVASLRRLPGSPRGPAAAGAGAEPAGDLLADDASSGAAAGGARLLAPGAAARNPYLPFAPAPAAHPLYAAGGPPNLLPFPGYMAMGMPPPGHPNPNADTGPAADAERLPRSRRLVLPGPRHAVHSRRPGAAADPGAAGSPPAPAADAGGSPAVLVPRRRVRFGFDPADRERGGDRPAPAAAAAAAAMARREGGPGGAANAGGGGGGGGGPLGVQELDDEALALRLQQEEEERAAMAAARRLEAEEHRRMMSRLEMLETLEAAQAQMARSRAVNAAAAAAAAAAAGDADRPGRRSGRERERDRSRDRERARSPGGGGWRMRGLPPAGLLGPFYEGEEGRGEAGPPGVPGAGAGGGGSGAGAGPGERDAGDRGGAGRWQSRALHEMLMAAMAGPYGMHRMGMGMRGDDDGPGYPGHRRGRHAAAQARSAALAMREQLQAAQRAGIPAHLLLSDRDFTPEDYEMLCRLDERVENRKGAKDEQLSMLPTEVVGAEGRRRSDGAPATCAVCLEELAGGDVAKRLPCGHEFHGPCVDQWLRTKAVCPICQRGLEG